MAHQTIDLSGVEADREGLWMLEVLHAWREEEGGDGDGSIHD